MKAILCTLILSLSLSLPAFAQSHRADEAHGKGGKLTQRHVQKLNADMRRAMGLVPAEAKKDGLTEEQIEQIMKALRAKKKPACLDQQGFNHFWVFAAMTTDVEYTITVTDTISGLAKTYMNEVGSASPAIVDTAAFATCP